MPNERRYHLSVVLPAYNEEQRIAATVLAVHSYLEKQQYASEIIVISDGSQDQTVAVVEGLHLPRVRVIVNPENHGKGYVVRQAMLAAQGAYRLFMDADNSTQIVEIEKFWPYFEEGYDIVIGSIEVAGSTIEEKAAWYRRALGRWAKMIIRLLLIWEIHDTQRGFKCFTAQSAEAVFPQQTVARWGFDMEIMLIAKKKGMRIKELPVHWVNPAGSKVNLRSYLLTFKELLKIKWNSLRGKYH